MTMLKASINQKKYIFTIGQRIMAGFSLLLAIALLFTVFIFLNQQVIRDYFADFNRSSEDATLMLAIDNSVIKLQRQILIFSQARNVSAITQIRELYNSSLSEIEILKERHDFFEKNDKKMLDNLYSSVVSFGENIQALEEQRIHSDSMYAQLQALYSVIYNITDQSLSSAQIRKDTEVSTLIHQAQRSFSRAETLGVNYLHKHKFEDKKQADNRLNQALYFIRQAQMLSTVPSSGDQLTHVITMLEKVKTVSFQTMQADRNYMFLVNIVISGEIAVFRDLSTQLTDRFIDRQQQIFSTTIKSLNWSQIATLSIAIFSAILAFIFAVIIGRSISGPIQKITKTFTELAKGVSLHSIPEMNRGDEIGELASAANVFRETNEKTQRLLKQSKLLAEDLEKGKQSLQKSNDELDNFAYVASHDLKAPLRAIDNLAQWIKEDCAEILPDESKDHLEKLQGRILRMENLLGELLRYSRVGRVEVKTETLNIRSVIDEAVELSNKPASFVFHIPENLPTVSVCVAPLVQVIQNLLTNAIKYNDKKQGVLFITIDDRSNSFLQFTVADNGPGIEKKYHERIFLMFQTLQARDVIEASGMGLAIVKKVVETEGGTVRIESALGEGSAFIFTWPKYKVAT